MAKGSGLFLGGVLLGGAIGAIAAIAADPRKTRQARRAVRETADRLPEVARDASTIAVETSARLGRQVAHLSQDFRDDWQATSQRLRDAAVAGVAASRQEYLNEIQAEIENGPKAE
ncbi:MAG: YtxH domain-containing protein [Geitlerinemataceae cyanobacterium]